jgi:hypothetical protein
MLIRNCLLIGVMLLNVGWASFTPRLSSATAGLSKAGAITATPTPIVVSSQPQAADNSTLPLFEGAAEPSRLEYGAYVISRQTKQFRDDGMTRPVELSYATLTHQGKQVLKFDAVNHPYGNETKFGFFQLFKGQPQHLIVEQSSHRWERSWIVQLSPLRLIFDNAWYEVGTNLVVKDLDQDGIPELIQRYEQFWFFQFGDSANTAIPTSFYNTNSPFTDIVFAYNSQARKYKPANPHFKEYVFAGLPSLEQRIEAQGRSNSFNEYLLSLVFERTLLLLFAGEEKRAWQGFQEACQWDNCATIEQRFRLKLKDDPVYQFFAKHR